MFVNIYFYIILLAK